MSLKKGKELLKMMQESLLANKRSLIENVNTITQTIHAPWRIMYNYIIYIVVAL